MHNKNGLFKHNKSGLFEHNKSGLFKHNKMAYSSITKMAYSSITETIKLKIKYVSVKRALVFVHCSQILNLILLLSSWFLLGFLSLFFTFFFERPFNSINSSIIPGLVKSSRFSLLRCSSSGLKYESMWWILVDLKTEPNDF